MPPAAAVEATSTSFGLGREGGTRSGRNVQNAFMVKSGVGGGGGGGDNNNNNNGASVKAANWNAVAPGPGKRQRISEKSDVDDGASTPGPNTPATTNSGGGVEIAVGGGGGGGGVGSEGNNKLRAAWSQEAVALGYETGTIKNSAYVLLAASGAKGMTVAAIVDAATKQG